CANLNSGGKIWIDDIELLDVGAVPTTTLATIESAVSTLDASTWKLSGDQTSAGIKTLEGGNATPLVLSRAGANVNASIQYKASNGSTVYAGLGPSNTFAIAGQANLSSAGERWFHVNASGAYVNENPVFHAGS